MSRTIIKNGNVYENGIIVKKDISFVDSVIIDSDFNGEIYENDIVIDASDSYVIPGFIDIHMHGGGDYDFMDASEDAIKGIIDAHIKCGTTTLVPTTVTSSDESLFKLFAAYRASAAKYPQLGGIHLEGPFLSWEKKGAHDEKYLRNPSDYDIDRLLYEGEGIISRCTAAPELPGSEIMTRKMIDKGIVMTLGHSDASATVCDEAFGWGFSHITHFYNMCPTVRKLGQEVHAGVVEAAYLNDNVTIELIGDGKHVPKEAFELALKIKSADKIAVITDALRPAGTNLTESYLGERIPENRIIIEDGVAKMPDRSVYAGSIATCKMCLDTMYKKYGISIEESIKMLTQTPASVMKLDKKGDIKIGYDADIVIMNREFDIKHVFSFGNMIV